MGALRWALPSSSTYASCERCLPSFCMNHPSFIAHTGGSGGDSVLPTRHPGGGAPHSGWFQGSWMPFPPSSSRLTALLGPSPSEYAEQHTTPAQAPQGVRLGGGQQPEDAKAAAAAAAEARAAAAAGGGSKGGASSSKAGASSSKAGSGGHSSSV